MTALSVVLPMHNTRDSLDELVARLLRSSPDGTELVFVDDACPQRSGDAVVGLQGRPGLRGRLVRLDRCVGQHAAVLIGLAHATGDAVAVMDADLQDAPEDLATLLRDLGPDVDAPQLVCAGRRGSYERAGRQVTGRWYRLVVSLLSRGRMPPDAGMFCVMTAAGRARVLALADPVAPLIPAAARAGVRIRSVPIDRRPRAAGTSSTGSRVRLRVGWRGVMTVSPLHGVARRYRRWRWQAPTVEVVELRPPTPEPAS